MILESLKLDRLPVKAVPVFFDHCLFFNEFKNKVIFPTHFTSFGIIALLTGNGKFKVNETDITLDQNSFLVVNRGSKVAFTINDNGIAKNKTSVVFLFFNHILSQLVAQNIFHNQIHVDKMVDDYTFIEHVHYCNASLTNKLHTLISLGNSCASFQALKADMLIRNILEDIISENYDALRISSNLEVIKQSTKVNLYKRLAIAKGWMEKNYSSSIQLNDLADITMINNQHFLRLFKKGFGKTPHQYLTEIRIKEAKNLLSYSSKQISEICYEVGFESISSFSILFKKHTGYSPTKYQKLQKETS